MGQQTNRVKNNTYTTRADDAVTLYRAEVEQTFNTLAQGQADGALLPSFAAVLHKLKKHKVHLHGKGTYLTRAQIANKLGISMPTVYRLFQLEKAPKPSSLVVPKEHFCTDEVFHFVRSVYPRTAPIYQAVLLMQIDAAIEVMGANFVLDVAQWFHTNESSVVVCNV